VIRQQETAFGVLQRTPLRDHPDETGNAADAEPDEETASSTAADPSTTVSTDAQVHPAQEVADPGSLATARHRYPTHSPEHLAHRLREDREDENPAASEFRRRGRHVRDEPDTEPHQVDPDLLRLVALAPADPQYQQLRRAVIEAHLPLVHHLAQRFKGRGEPYDDLVQVGTIGLLHAVDRFDPQRGTFSAFAVPTIVGEIRRHFRDRGWAMRIPRRIQDLGRRVSEARETLTHTLDRSPTVREIAEHLDVDADLVLEALETASAYITVPLQTTAEESDRMGKTFEDAGLELVEQRETLRPLLARLPVRERRILELRFGKGLSQSQIATEVGVSQMHVSRLLTKSLNILRSGLTQEL